MDFLHWLEMMGGVCTTAAAREHITARTLRQLRDTGALWVPLRGWVALDGIRNDVTHALELGGVVSCVSAFRAHGIWTPHGDERVHIRVHRDTHSDRVDTTAQRAGTLLHRLHRGIAEERPWDGIDRVQTALAVASGCVADSDLVAAADAALNQRKVRPAALHELAKQLRGGRGRTLLQASALSGSGTESVFASMMRRRRIRFVQQPELLPGEFFDFLIGRSLVIEIDSLEWHGSREQMAKDRVRDAKLTALGYRVVRFTYEQVMFNPEHVLGVVLDLVRRDVHERALFAQAD